MTEPKLYSVHNPGATVGFSGGASFPSGADKTMSLTPTEAATLAEQGFQLEEAKDQNAEPDFFVDGWSGKR